MTMILLYEGENEPSETCSAHPAIPWDISMSDEEESYVTTIEQKEQKKNLLDQSNDPSSSAYCS